MKKRILYLCLSLLLCLSVLFCGLWMREQQNHSDLEQLCRYSAHRACERFSDYRDTGSAYSYHYGVSELVSFYNAYMKYVTEVYDQTDTNCISLNQLIGELMFFSELDRDHANAMVSITAMLSEDIFDENAYQEIFSLYSDLSR